MIEQKTAMTRGEVVVALVLGLLLAWIFIPPLLEARREVKRVSPPARSREAHKQTLPAPALPSQHEVSKLMLKEPEAGKRFGHSISFSDDLLLVGAPMKGPGHVFVFTHKDGHWHEEVCLSAPPGEGFFFGHSVSADCDHVAIAATQRPDSVFVLERKADSFELKRNFVGERPNVEFGYTVHVRYPYLAIRAAHWSKYAGPPSPAAYAYMHDGENWLGPARLVAPAGLQVGQFTGPVCVGSEWLWAGTNLYRLDAIASAIRSVKQIVPTRPPEGSLAEEQSTIIGHPIATSAFGVRTAIVESGDAALIAHEKGLCLLRYDGGEWVEGQELIRGEYCHSVAMNAKYILAGNYDNNEVRVFEHRGSDWEETLLLVPEKVGRSRDRKGNRFGWAIGISGTQVAVGAPFDDEAAENAGAVYFFELP